LLNKEKISHSLPLTTASPNSFTSIDTAIMKSAETKALEDLPLGSSPQVGQKKKQGSLRRHEDNHLRPQCSSDIRCPNKPHPANHWFQSAPPRCAFRHSDNDGVSSSDSAA
jgi:hypothetical protein